MDKIIITTYKLYKVLCSFGKNHLFGFPTLEYPVPIQVRVTLSLSIFLSRRYST